MDESSCFAAWRFGGKLNLAGVPAARERRVWDRATVVAFNPPNGYLFCLMRFFLVEAENALRPGG